MRRELLVEGVDDEHVLIHICRSRGIPDVRLVKPSDEDIQELGGIEALLPRIPVRLKAAKDPGDAVGVVVDADLDLNARWEAVRGRLMEAGYEGVPSLPVPDGTIVEPPPGSLLPRTGVWIMPDNKVKGILEDFLTFLVPQLPNPLFSHATASVNSIPDKRFIDNDRSKAVMHTWLAWQKNPGRPYGTAIKAGFLNSDAPQADVLVGWLERLFSQV